MILIAIPKAALTALFAVALVLLVGCGQKGPLQQPQADQTTMSTE